VPDDGKVPNDGVLLLQPIVHGHDQEKKGDHAEEVRSGGTHEARLDHEALRSIATKNLAAGRH
jgi:hypothetical protein